MARTPKRAPAAHVALLRAINVGGTRKVPMAELRALAEGCGLAAVSTYIQSGNLLFVTDRPGADVAAELEGALQRDFGFHVDVVVRSRAAWEGFAAGSPFPDAEQARPNLLHLGLSTRPTRPDAIERLQPYARAGERLALRDDALWIDYPAGAGTTKLTPAVLERCVGSPVTARNWRTVTKLAELLAALDP